MMAKYRAATFALILGGSLVAANVAPAAIELEPGQWQDTETGEEDGKPVKPEVTSECMSPEEAKDPVKQITAMKDAAGQCKKLDIKENNGTVTIDMLCGDPKQMEINMSGTYKFIDKKHYTGTMKSVITLAGKTTSANKTVDSKWLGPCKAAPTKKK